MACLVQTMDVFTQFREDGDPEAHRHATSSETPEMRKEALTFRLPEQPTNSRGSWQRIETDSRL